MTLQHALAHAFLTGHPTDAARALERMPADWRAAVVREAPVEAAAALGEMVTGAAAECLVHLKPEEAAPALEAVPLETAIAVLRNLPEETARRFLEALPADRQETLGRVLRHPDGTAAALMDPAVAALPDDISVGEARVRVRRQGRGLLYYLFVVDRGGRLVGVLDIPELMRAHGHDRLRTVMRQPVEHLPAWTPASAVRAHPGWRTFHAMPVTDEAGRLVGAIRYQTLRRLGQEVDVSRGARLTALTAGALGELFHLGVAGFVEGVASAAAPRDSGRTSPSAAAPGAQ